MVHLKNKTVCSACWATIDIEDTECPVCNSTVNKDLRSDIELREDVDGLTGSLEDTSSKNDNKFSLVAIASILIILLIVMAVGFTYGKDVVVAQPVTIDDFIGDWEVIDVVGLEDLINRSDNGVGMKFSLTKKNGLIESSSPLPGRLDFNAQLE